MMKLQTARHWTFALLLLVSTCLPAAGDWQGTQQAALDAYQQQDYARAEQLLQQAIRIAEQADNGTGYKVSSLSLLAYVQWAQGQSQQALASQQQALTLARRVYAPTDAELAQLCFNRGDLLEQSGQAEAAMAAYVHALETARSGEQPALLLKHAQALARLQLAQGQVDAAADVARSALRVAGTEGFSETRRQLAYLLAGAQQQRQQIAQAQETLEQQWSLERQALPDNDPRADETLERLIEVLEQQGLQAQAVARRQQLQVRRERSGELSRASVLNLNALALAHQAQGEFAAAQQLYTQAWQQLDVLQQTRGLEAALLLGNWGGLLEEQGDRSAALARYRESLALGAMQRQQPRQAANIAGRLGALLYGLRRYAEAEQPFLDALAWLQQESAEPADLAVALGNLVNLYSAWHKPQRKARYQRQLKALRT